MVLRKFYGAMSSFVPVQLLWKTADRFKVLIAPHSRGFSGSGNKTAKSEPAFDWDFQSLSW